MIVGMLKHLLDRFFKKPIPCVVPSIFYWAVVEPLFLTIQMKKGKEESGKAN
jgi:hypothetical protein